MEFWIKQLDNTGFLQTTLIHMIPALPDYDLVKYDWKTYV